MPKFTLVPPSSPKYSQRDTPKTSALNTNAVTRAQRSGKSNTRRPASAGRKTTNGNSHALMLESSSSLPYFPFSNGYATARNSAIAMITAPPKIAAA